MHPSLADQSSHRRSVLGSRQSLAAVCSLQHEFCGWDCLIKKIGSYLGTSAHPLHPNFPMPKVIARAEPFPAAFLSDRCTP